MFCNFYINLKPNKGLTFIDIYDIVKQNNNNKNQDILNYFNCKKNIITYI